MNKITQKLKAEETLQIIEKGKYKSISGRQIFIADKINQTISNTEFYTSEQLKKVSNDITRKKQFNTKIEMTEEDTISCLLRLQHEEELANVMCLNFASAKNPGGGFLNGAIAQEESLAVSSTLYASQQSALEFYKIHRNMTSCIYTDAMIYSPLVTVFRNMKGELLDNNMSVNIITSAAVNAGVVRKKQPEIKNSINEIMSKRIDKLLSLCVFKSEQTLVLGAWGCGVFQNNPEDISRLFAEKLNGKFKGQFKRVIFAIYSKNTKFISAFKTNIKNSFKLF